MHARGGRSRTRATRAAGQTRASAASGSSSARCAGRSPAASGRPGPPTVDKATGRLRESRTRIVARGVTLTVSVVAVSTRPQPPATERRTVTTAATEGDFAQCSRRCSTSTEPVRVRASSSSRSRRCARTSWRRGTARPPCTCTAATGRPSTGRRCSRTSRTTCTCTEPTGRASGSATASTTAPSTCAAMPATSRSRCLTPWGWSQRSSWAARWAASSPSSPHSTTPSASARSSSWACLSASHRSFRCRCG